MRASLYMAACAAALTLSVPASAYADPCNIDYQAKTIKCTGKAGPNPNAPTVAAARIGAEKAARMDAQRNILEAFNGIETNGKKIGDTLKDSPDVSSKVRGLIANFKIVDTRYYDDGGVDLDVEMPLDGLLSAAGVTLDKKK